MAMVEQFGEVVWVHHRKPIVDAQIQTLVNQLHGAVRGASRTFEHLYVVHDAQELSQIGGDYVRTFADLAVTLCDEFGPGRVHHAVYSRSPLLLSMAHAGAILANGRITALKTEQDVRRYTEQIGPAPLHLAESKHQRYTLAA